MSGFALFTERYFDPRDSRVERCELRLRSEADARRIAFDLQRGKLRPAIGTYAWVAAASAPNDPSPPDHRKEPS